MSRNGPPRAWSKAQRRKRDYKKRLERVTAHLETIKVLRTLMAEAEQRGEKKTAVRINTRIRTLRQQIRYIGVDPDELSPISLSNERLE